MGLGAGPGEETAGAGLERGWQVSREHGSPVKEKGLNPAGRAAHSGLWARLAVAPSPRGCSCPGARSMEHKARRSMWAGWKLPPAARDRPRRMASVAGVSTRTLTSE